ncbi:MAG: hypothetical protein GY942_12900, partial [Aestuariibacter sp.]|nr:hypothetical protein [Aestuariibacter sp.]
MTDYTLGETIYKNFPTRAFSTGIPTVLAGTPVLSIIEDNSATPITAGITLTVSIAAVVGLNNMAIVATAANGFESGKEYSVYISTGTVDGVSAVGEVVAEFSIGKSAVYKSQIALAGGVVDSGSTTTIVDAALLTQSTTDHWKGAQVRMTGGTAANIGAVRTITGFTPASDLITFSPALVATV